MADKENLVVKAVLQYPEGLELGTSPDIKRFRVVKEKKADGKDLYCRLVNRLSTVFPDITGVNYSLHWKDAEGDLVEFSSQDELQMAVDAATDDVLRIYIIVHFDDVEETTEAETDGQSSDAKDSSKKKKRVRFVRAGRKLRRQIRRRRRAALSDPRVISKEFRTGARVFIRHLHQNDKDGVEVELPEKARASLDEMAPEVRAFIQMIHEEWHAKLASQKPRVVVRRMRMKQRTLPPALERAHFLWLLRLIGRWHRRHADLCRAMSGWSSGETGLDDDSGGEETMLSALRRRRKRMARRKRIAEKSQQKGEGATLQQQEKEEEEEDEEEKESPEQQKVAREFRQAARTLMRQIHKKDGGGKDEKQQDKPALAALSPEVRTFMQRVAEDWHKLLAKKAPSKVARRMRRRQRDLPADLQKEHFLWLCRYFRRWHARHATRCAAMSGWSSGEEEEEEDDEDAAKEEEEKQQRKGKKGKSSSSASSSESDSEDKKKKKKAVPKEFVKAARILVNYLHDRKPKKAEKASEEETTLAALSPEARAFVESFAQEWDRKLSKGKSPQIVARRMKLKWGTTSTKRSSSSSRTLPPGVEQAHVGFLCRFLARWHGKHAAFCGPMASYSSGETGGGEGDSGTSGDERASLKRRAKRAALLDASSASEMEDTDCVETACKPVSKEFRTGVRQWINQQHKSSPTEKEGKKQAKTTSTPTSTLSQDVQQFLQRFMDDWHAKVASGSPPRAASRQMKKAAQGPGVSLPSRMEREELAWLCCFVARWHRKHGDRCDILLTSADN